MVFLWCAFVIRYNLSIWRKNSEERVGSNKITE